METADNQLKTCEKIIHRLYGENNDLTKENLNLEGKLKTASRSQDNLQRKKILLQKLVDKLSHHIGKEVQHQSFLLLELDKDVSLWSGRKEESIFHFFFNPTLFCWVPKSFSQDIGQLLRLQLSSSL